MRELAFALLLLPAGACSQSGGVAPAPRPAAPLVAEIITLREHSRSVDWNHRTDLIAFDQLGADGYYDVHSMRSDGSRERSLTAGHPDLPNRNIGQPAWHPSGKYVVFQAEKPEHREPRLKRVVEPGEGVYSDLWLLELATDRAYPLRVVPNRRGSGILHAHFSSDGAKLSWSEMYEPGRIAGKRNLLGWWRLMVADFSFAGGRPRLGEVRSFEPGGPGFYENHGFSSDGRTLLFSSNFEGVSRLDCHIYTLDLASGKMVRLTEGKGWNEHAHFSPDDRHIVWMVRNDDTRGTDYWIMRSDGGAKRRLTFFNRKGHSHYAGDTVIVADMSWGPDGETIAAFHRRGAGLESKKSPKKTILIRLNMDAIRESEARRD